MTARILPFAVTVGLDVVRAVGFAALSLGDREKAARMASALFCFCVMPGCRRTRAAVYGAIGADSDDVARLDSEAIALFRKQIESVETAP